MKISNEQTVDVFLGIATLTITVGLVLKCSFSLPGNIEELILQSPLNLMIDWSLMLLFPASFQEWWNDLVAANTTLSNIIVSIGITLLLFAIALRLRNEPRKTLLELVGIMSLILTLYFSLYSYWYLIEWLNVDSVPSGVFAILMLLPWVLGFCLTTAYIATKLGLFEQSQYDQTIKDITQIFRSENTPD